MEKKEILLVEDNPDDEMLTLRAFEKSRVANRIVVVRDGVEALDYLFARGAYAKRVKEEVPQVVLLDIKLPKIDGLGVLRAIRNDETTRLVPVVILASSREEQDLVRSYDLGANSYVCKPVDFNNLAEAAHQLGLYWILLNQVPPVRRGI
ncbi:MAG: two-component system response regulator [Elusimicrobia bacterium RIFOXYB2_FULL_49_7]|nr:MAG: two-component system response regulator [Elusimicrobia bacterium RIFOXYB2_FULL_49_7]